RPRPRFRTASRGPTRPELPMTERDIFVAAYQRPNPADRRQFLDEACGHDPTLRQRVEDLLGLAAGAGSFLEQPAVGPPETAGFAPGGPGAARATTAVAGAGVGPSELMEVVGE